MCEDAADSTHRASMCPRGRSGVIIISIWKKGRNAVECGMQTGSEGELREKSVRFSRKYKSFPIVFPVLHFGVYFPSAAAELHMHVGLKAEDSPALLQNLHRAFLPERIYDFSLSSAYRHHFLRRHRTATRHQRRDVFARRRQARK